jgi:predicted nucleotidyltransferase
MPKTAIKLSKKGILDFLKAHKRDLTQFKVHAIGLFGSYSRGQQKDSSDIDFLVEFEAGRKTYDNFIGLIDYLESVFGKEVELVTRESVSKHILPYIEKEVEYVQVSD